MHIGFHNDGTAVATAIVGFAILLSLRRFSDLIWYVCSVYLPLTHSPPPLSLAFMLAATGQKNFITHNCWILC